MGLINSLAPQDELMPVDVEMIKKVCTMAQLAVRATKAAVLREPGFLLPDEALPPEDPYQDFLSNTADAVSALKHSKNNGLNISMSLGIVFGKRFALVPHRMKIILRNREGGCNARENIR